MRYQPLKHSLFGILMGLIVAMTAMCAAILLLSGLQFQSTHQSMENQSIVSAYFHAVDSAQQMLLSRFTSADEADREEADAQLQALQRMATQMAGAFDIPQFIDVYYLTETYIEAANDFLAMDALDDPEALLGAYTRAQRVQTFIKNQYTHLTTVKEAIAAAEITAYYKLWRTRVVLVIVSVFTVSGLLLFCGMTFIRRIVTPITQLTRTADEIAGGNLNIALPLVSPQQNDETQVLIRAFTSMTETVKLQMRELEDKIALSDEVHALEMENMRMQVTLSSTEMLFMQSLINPHFLFNCLTTLSSLAYIEKAPNVRRASSEIAYYLRESLQRIGKEVSIHEELSHIQRYISIQQLRFRDRITFSIESDPCCKDAILPALILQPLVENAISHGVSSYMEGGVVSVAVRGVDDGGLVLEVSDNGVGIPPERILQIEEDLRLPFDTRQTGIGFRSVLSRLRAAFGAEMSYTIVSVPGSTKVTIRLPNRAGTAADGML